MHGVVDQRAERNALGDEAMNAARPDLWLAELEAENASLRLAALPTRKHSDAAWERKVTELGADAMIAHRWFEKRFGEVMNGRDFAVKCEMADRRLAELLAAARDASQLLVAIAAKSDPNPGFLDQADDLTERIRAAVAAFEEAPRG